MGEESAQKSSIENYFLQAQPSAEPMEGIEQFTICEAGNPLLCGGKANAYLISELDKKMREKLFLLCEKKIKITKRSSHYDIALAPAMVASSAEGGAINMQIMLKPQIQQVDAVAEMLVDELWHASGQDISLSLSILDSFWSRLEQCEYKAPELMSVLLVCAEEQYLAARPPHVEGAKPPHEGYAQLIFNVPIKEEAAGEGTFGQIGKGSIMHNMKSLQENLKGGNLQKSIGGEKEMPDGGWEKRANAARRRRALAAAQAGIKIVSIREMLLHYFRRHPSRYRKAVASVVGSEIENATDAGQLRQIIEAKIEQIGAWEFAIRVWENVSGFKEERQEIGEYFSEDNGLSPPEFGARYWLVCPRWHKDFSDEDISKIAKLILEHMRKA